MSFEALNHLTDCCFGILYGLWNTWEFFFYMAVFQTQGCGVALLLWIRVVVDRQKPAPVGTVNTLRFIIFFCRILYIHRKIGILYWCVYGVWLRDVEDLFGSPGAAHSSPFVADSMISAASDTLIAGQWDGGRYEGWHAGAPKKPATLGEVKPPEFVWHWEPPELVIFFRMYKYQPYKILESFSKLWDIAIFLSPSDRIKMEGLWDSCCWWSIFKRREHLQLSK